MNIRNFVLLSLLGFVLSACGNSATDNSQSDSSGKTESSLEKPPVKLERPPNTDKVPASLRPPEQ